ncbi:MAG: hypothetical protein IJ460_08395 [Clostridia bacterium]|nr:hypothetical protein [Clostridia bacterium]
MNTILLIFVIIGVTLQQVCKKAFNTRVSGGTYSFSAASAFFAIIVFIATGKGSFALSYKAMSYSVGFAAAYGVSVVGSMLAISTGPLALTSLIVQYSLVIPAMYGLIALDEPMDIWLICGIVLLLISLILINRETEEEQKKITFTWGVYAFLSFVGNGACSVIQKMQQIDCSGMYKNEFMIAALAITAIVLMLFGIFYEKDMLIFNLKKGFIWYVICGLANGVVNFFVLVLSLRLPASVMFPVISAGGIIATALVSMFVYKEKLSSFQKIGFLLGIIAIVVLNL